MIDSDILAFTLTLWAIFGAAFACVVLWFDWRNNLRPTLMEVIGLLLVCAIFWPWLLGIGEEWPVRDDGKERGNAD